MGIPGKINLILLGENPESPIIPSEIEKQFASFWQAKDVGLKINKLGNSVEITSDRIFIDAVFSDLLKKTSDSQQEVLTYLVNSLRTRSNSTPYSFVSALPPDMLPPGTTRGNIV